MAETTANQLRLQSAAIVDISGHQVTIHSDPQGQPNAMTASYRFVNLSNNVAKDIEIDVQFWINLPGTYRKTSTRNFLSPTKSFWMNMHIPTTSPESQKLSEGFGMINLAFRIKWINPLGEESINAFHRRLIRNPGTDKWVSNSIAGGQDE